MLEELTKLKKENQKLITALKNIAKGKIDKCCCAEEYANKILKEG